MRIFEILTESETPSTELIHQANEMCMAMFASKLHPELVKVEVGKGDNAIFTYSTVGVSWTLVKDILANRRINALPGKDGKSVDGYSSVFVGTGKNKVEYFVLIHYEVIDDKKVIGSLRISFQEK